MRNSFGCVPSVSAILSEVAAATGSKDSYIASAFERFDNAVPKCSPFQKEELLRCEAEEKKTRECKRRRKSRQARITYDMGILGQ
jgi:hypothetical protein